MYRLRLGIELRIMEIKMEIDFRKLHADEAPPTDLLLLADPSEKLVKQYLKKGTCYVAEYEKVVIGAAIVMGTGPGTVEIMNIAVREDFQNKGIGKQFLLFLIDEIKKGKAQRIEIGTGNPGVVQMLLYQKCGFRIMGVDFNFFRRNYPERIYENGIECRDMIRMKIDL